MACSKLILLLLSCFTFNVYAQPFFKTGSAYIYGNIKGFSGKTAEITIVNSITTETIPYLVEIDPEGNFGVSLRLNYPVHESIQSQKLFIPFYIIPGDSLKINVEWDSITQTYKSIDYSGPSGKVNRELLQALSITLPKIQLANSIDYDSRIAFSQEISRVYKEYLSALSAFARQNDFLPETQKILQNEALLNRACKMFANEVFVTPEDKQYIKDPQSDPYYDYLKEIPWNDTTLLSTYWFKEFIENFDFCIIALRKWIIQESPELMLRTLKEAGYPFTPEAKALEAYKGSWAGKEKQEEIKAVENYYKDSLLYGTAQPELYKKVLFEEEMKLGQGIIMDIMTVRGLSTSLRYSKDRESAIKIYNYYKPKIEDPYLAGILAEMVEIFFPSVPQNVARELPEGTAKEVWNRLISPHKGKVVLIDFWAAWCGPCLSGIENLEPLREQFKNKDVAFVFITSETNTSAEQLNRIMKTVTGYKYRLNEDDYNYLSQQFKVTVIPRYILVGRAGNIVNENFNPYDLEETAKKIEELLK